MLNQLNQRRAGRTFDEIYQHWLLHIRQFAENSQISYTRIVKQFRQYAPQYIDDLRLEHFEQYIAHILASQASQTANNYLMILKSFGKWLISQGFECATIKLRAIRANPPNPRLLTEQEYQKILSVCQSDEADLVQFIANTGLRKDQILNLTWSNISPDRRYIAMIGKGRKRLMVPLNQTCRDILSRSSAAYPLKFLESHPRHRNAIYILCSRLAKRAAIPAFGPHALRHYFATKLYLNGVPLHFISKCLGHADTRTTETIYCHIFGPTDLLGLTDCLDK